MNSWFTNDTAAHVGPNNTTWLEVSLWQEFKWMFQDKDNWRYVLRKGYKYGSCQRLGWCIIARLMSWELLLGDATMYGTYGEAYHVMERLKKSGDKKINIVILRPISRITE